MPDDTTTTGERGWFWPSDARKAHFDGGDGRALCGRWMRINPFTRAAAPIDGDLTSPPSKDDCVVCRRQVDLLEAREAREAAASPTTEEKS